MEQARKSLLVLVLVLVLVLARRDHAEAMRVAAGLTIFGHRVGLIFMTGPVAQTPENAAHAEPDFDTSKAHFRDVPSTGAGSQGLEAKTPSHMDCC